MKHIELLNDDTTRQDTFLSDTNTDALPCCNSCDDGGGGGGGCGCNSHVCGVGDVCVTCNNAADVCFGCDNHACGYDIF